MSEGLEDYMGKPAFDGLEERQELRDAKADERERQLDEARDDERKARSNLKRTEIRFYKYGGASRADLLQAQQDALSATARRADLEEGS